MTAYDEFSQHGQFGRDGLRLLQRLMREEIRRFPALQPDAGIGRQLDDLVQEFFLAQGQALTLALTTQCHDEEAIGRYVRKSVRNWLIGQARQTTIGRLRRAVETALSSSPDYEQTSAKHFWRMTGTDGPPFSGDPAPLVAAGRGPSRGSVEGRIPAVVRAIFTAAGGCSLEVARLTGIVAQLSRAALDPVQVSLDEEDAAEVPDPSSGPADLLVRADDEMDAATRAAEIVGALTAQERQLVGLLDDPTAAQALLQVGRSVAYQRTRMLKALLVQLAGTDDHGRAVMSEIVELCRA